MHPTIGRVICALRKERGLRQKELAELAQLKQPNLSRIEAGTVMPRKATLERLARALGKDYLELISEELRVKLESRWGELLFPGGKKSAPIIPDGTAVPVFDTRTGYGVPAEPSGRPVAAVLETLYLPDLPEDAFGIVVFGDSMENESDPDSFRHGDIVVCAETEPVPGCFAFILTADAYTFRRVFFDETGSVRLAALNPHTPEKTLTREVLLKIWPVFCLVRRYQH